MSMIEDKAKLACGCLAGDAVSTEAGIDPATLAVIMQVILALVQAFTGCKIAAAQATKAANKPGPFHKLFVRRTVRQQTDDVFYKQHGREVVEGLLNAGSNTTEADMAQMYVEAEQV